jgi:16S rRNA C967 or C1407 C5-methylase (RsmB/RsmF family)/NOL1/NOP2/fmu family ribosome biogenesis protein
MNKKLDNMNIPFPAKFESRVKNDSFLGTQLLDALNTEPPVSVRMNPLKHKVSLPVSHAISWCDQAFYLTNRPSYTLDPLFHAGCYYPQEAGSMILDYVLKQLPLPDEPVVLDLCAAPGGKSTLIASFLENRGVLLANEVIPQRAHVLRENLTKWGHSNTLVSSSDPADFKRLPHFFDVILVDAPCSGEGMFRKDPKSRSEWSEDTVKFCAARQKRILMDVWDALSPGGFLIYSTCTFNEEENEKNVDWLISETGATLVNIEMPEGVLKGRQEKGNYCIPGVCQSEGYYIAVIQKNDSPKTKQRTVKNTNAKHQQLPDSAIRYVTIGQNEVINWKEKLVAIPAQHKEIIMVLQTQLRIFKLCTTIGELTPKGFVPGKELAMNPSLNTMHECISLTEKEALNYLHGDTFKLNGNFGYQLMCFEQIPLGWIKHLGNRFNNLYPKEWRIRMDVNR